MIQFHTQGLTDDVGLRARPRRANSRATLTLETVHILRNPFLAVSRPLSPLRNQIRHWIKQKLHSRNHSETPPPPW